METNGRDFSVSIKSNKPSGLRVKKGHDIATIFFKK